MKQRITVSQASKLTDAHKERLREWWSPEQGDYFTEGQRQFIAGNIVRNGDMVTYGEDMPHGKDGLTPLLTIGQMIAFIQEKKPQLKGIAKNRFDKWFVNIETAQLGHKDELCDALWEATVQVLKNP